MAATLRPWREEDAPAYRKVLDDEQVSAYLTDGVPYPYPLEEAERYIEAALAASPDRQIDRVIEVDGELAGALTVCRKVDVYSGTGVIAYVIGREHWGRGLMTAMVAQACTEAFRQLDIRRLEAEVFAPNIGSRRVLEKNGFTLEAVRPSHVVKRGVVMDSCIYGLLREEWRHA